MKVVLRTLYITRVVAIIAGIFIVMARGNPLTLCVTAPAGLGLRPQTPSYIKNYRTLPPPLSLPPPIAQNIALMAPPKKF